MNSICPAEQQKNQGISSRGGVSEAAHIWSRKAGVHHLRELGTETTVTGPCICDKSDVGHYGSKHLQTKHR